MSEQTINDRLEAARGCLDAIQERLATEICKLPPQSSGHWAISRDQQLCHAINHILASVDAIARELSLDDAIA